MKPEVNTAPLVKSLDGIPVTPPKKTHKFNPKLLLTGLGGLAGVVILFAIIGYFSLYRPGMRLLAQVRQLEATGRDIIPQVKSQDLAAIQSQLGKVKTDLEAVKKEYQSFSWLKVVPVVSAYVQDGEGFIQAAEELLAAGDVTISAIAPYADVIGLKGISGGGDGGKTAQDRITFIVNTIDKLRPELDKIGGHLEAAKQAVSKVDPARYPESFNGQAVRSQLDDGLKLLSDAATLTTEAKPLLESAPYILGTDSVRRYLVLFQNDAEIRGTGGFMTGYAVIEVNKGKITTITSDDIYKLDEKFPKKIKAPDAILKFLPLVPYWYLRDQNLSPDFRVSMETFMPNYKLTREPTVDGVIAVDTQVLVDLLKVTGKIGVPGYGNFGADEDPRCNCPNVFYELQLLAGGEEPVVWDSVSGKIVQAPANYGNRKGFLGPVMYSILANTMAQPKSKMPDLFRTGLDNLKAKHILLYFFDAKAQSAAESFNIAGRVREPEQDYLMVVDSNFSGAKTNIWVTYKADSKVEIGGDGSVTKTLTLTYSNPQSKAVKITEARNLNGLFRDWVRVYVPKGSELIETKGYESGQAVSVDLDKTVFEGFFTLAPGNTRQISLKYKLPTKVTSPYKLLIQKQGGSKVFPYTITVNNKSKPEILLDGDHELVYSY